MLVHVLKVLREVDNRLDGMVTPPLPLKDSEMAPLTQQPLSNLGSLD